MKWALFFGNCTSEPVLNNSVINGVDHSNFRYLIRPLNGYNAVRFRYSFVVLWLLRASRSVIRVLLAPVCYSAYHGHLTSMIDVSPYKLNLPGGPEKPEWVHVVSYTHCLGCTRSQCCISLGYVSLYSLFILISQLYWQVSIIVCNKIDKYRMIKIVSVTFG